MKGCLLALRGGAMYLLIMTTRLDQTLNKLCVKLQNDCYKKYAIWWPWVAPKKGVPFSSGALESYEKCRSIVKGCQAVLFAPFSRF